MKMLPRRLRRSLATPGRDGAAEPILQPRPKVIESDALRWIQIEEPRLADRIWMAENFGFHELDLVMQFPRYDNATGRLHSAELDIFIGHDYLITLPNEPIVPLPQLFERVETREEVRTELMSKGVRLPALPGP